MTEFDAIAVAYDALIDAEKRWSREAPLLCRLLAEAGEGERRVLDLGCGTGFHAIHLARQPSVRVTASDPAQAMLEAAQAKPGAEQVKWVRADALQPPTGPFDLILLLGNTLSLLEQPGPVLHAVAGVAAPEAIFIIQQLDFDSLRQKGEQRSQRRAEGRRIEKTLTPLDEPGLGARLHLVVRSPTGEVLGETEQVQREHDPQRLIELAARAGWELREERRSYEDPHQGSDRIHIFQRQAR